MSFDLISVLQSGASEAVIDAFTQQLGSGVKRNQTSKAVEGGVSILMNALASLPSGLRHVSLTILLYLLLFIVTYSYYRDRHTKCYILLNFITDRSDSP